MIASRREPGESRFRLLTAGGPAAISVYRVTGPRTEAFLKPHLRVHGTLDLADRIPGDVRRATLLDGDDAIDEVLVTCHAAPPAWDLRLHIHGGPALQRRCAELFSAAGLAPDTTDDLAFWPAESTIEAEAYAGLPGMLSDRGMRWMLAQARRLPSTLHKIIKSRDLDAARAAIRTLLDRRNIVAWFSHPLRVALTGAPNAGKSTLLNAIADRHVSIVSSVAGTTRDDVDMLAEAHGFPVIWTDTAGLRASHDTLESAGIARTRRVLTEADVVVAVVDATVRDALPAELGELAGGSLVIARNKMDLTDGAAGQSESSQQLRSDAVVPVSALQRTGLDELLHEILAAAGRSQAPLELAAPFTDRQSAKLESAATAPDWSTLAAELTGAIGGHDRAKPAAADDA